MLNRQRGICWRASTGGWPTGRIPRPMRRPPGALTGCPAPRLVAGKSRTNPIQTGEGSEAMTAKRAFISFDFDHDDDLRNALVGQAKYPNSPFEIVDASVRRHLRGDWERQVRRRIGIADLVIVMCGEHTHQAEGVAIEVKIAQEEGVEYFLLRGHSDRVCTKPTSARSDDEMHEWTWDNLRKLIEGKTFGESVEELLSSPAPWLLAAGLGLALLIRSRVGRNRLAKPRQTRGTAYGRAWPNYPENWEGRF